MKDKILINKENYIDVIHGLKYGYKTVIYENDHVHILVLEMIESINEFTGKCTLREDFEYIDESINGEWVSIKTDNVYRLISSSYENNIPVLHDNNYKIEQFAIKAKKESIFLVIDNFETALTKYAKRIAIKYNVKFTGSGFNGKANSLPVKRQIENAFLSGKYNISFPCDTYNPQTIRNYASVYGNLIGQKLKVEITKGLLTVHFKELDETTKLLNSARDIFDKIGLKIGKNERNKFFYNLLGAEKSTLELPEPIKSTQYNSDEPVVEIPKFVPVVNGKEVSIDEWKKQPIWIRQGFVSEYNMDKEIKGSIDMDPSANNSKQMEYDLPPDTRFDVDENEEVQKPNEFDWDSLEKKDEDDDF